MDSPLYLLDANACIRLINGASLALADRLRNTHPTRICMSSIVFAELHYGARNSTHVAENLRTVQRLAAPFVHVAHDLTLVTHNVREFERVVGLMIEDWEAE